MVMDLFSSPLIRTINGTFPHHICITFKHHLEDKNLQKKINVTHRLHRYTLTHRMSVCLELSEIFRRDQKNT